MRISDWSSDVCSSDLIPAVAREAFETLGLRIEAQHRVGAEVGDPDLVGLVDIDRVRTRLVAGEFPGLPVAGRRFVAAELARTPFADPQPSVRSEEHTSELQSLMRISYAVFCLKKKINNN